MFELSYTKYGGADMDYREEIKKIIDLIHDQDILRLLYKYVKAGLKEEQREEKV